MIDYGLFALIVVILVLVFLAFHAWRSIRAEADRISAQWTKIEARIAESEHVAGAAMAEAKTATALAQEVQGTHYKTLLRRIDEAEQGQATGAKALDVLETKLASLGGRMSNLVRWSKGIRANDQADDQTDEQAEEPAFQQEEMFPVGNKQVTGNFGKIPRRKVV